MLARLCVFDLSKLSKTFETVRVMEPKSMSSTVSPPAILLASIAFYIVGLDHRYFGLQKELFGLDNPMLHNNQSNVIFLDYKTDLFAPVYSINDTSTTNNDSQKTTNPELTMQIDVKLISILYGCIITLYFHADYLLVDLNTTHYCR